MAALIPPFVFSGALSFCLGGCRGPACVSHDDTAGLTHRPHSYTGVDEIVDRGCRKTSFAYKLEIPQELGEVQQELQIKKEASYTLSMKVITHAQHHCCLSFACRVHVGSSLQWYCHRMQQNICRHPAVSLGLPLPNP